MTKQSVHILIVCVCTVRTHFPSLGLIFLCDVESMLAASTTQLDVTKMTNSVEAVCSIHQIELDKKISLHIIDFTTTCYTV